MTTIHAALGTGTLALAVVLVVTTAASAMLAGRMAPVVRAWAVDGLALLVEALVLLAALAGPLLLATGHAPADVLHFLYALIALGALPVTLTIAMSRGAKEARRDRWLALGALILAGVAVRLLQTG